MINPPEQLYKEGDVVTAGLNGKDGVVKLRHGKVLSAVYIFDEDDGKTQWRYSIADHLQFELVPEDQIINPQNQEVDEV